MTLRVTPSMAAVLYHLANNIRGVYTWNWKPYSMRSIKALYKRGLVYCSYDKLWTVTASGYKWLKDNPTRYAVNEKEK